MYDKPTTDDELLIAVMLMKETDMEFTSQRAEILHHVSIRTQVPLGW